ncbi:lactonase family protein [Labedella endophytica]|uniref:3-carboxymuconate cyclase n=1 Tax=Labedella endophytica TaxID=1523160 RepID=A0A433JTC0_9MICO|nr:beta-propeller fold lactonase family protein [Labedella endophytica]RUR01571.1 3-carboxymuconate cyclase [Labedella endophytica]
MDETTVAFWLGSYTPGDAGTGEGNGVGIRALRRDPSGGLVPVTHRASDSPSWVVQHPALAVVYAAEEFSGLILALRAARDGTLAAFGSPVDVGGGACHLSVSPDATSLIATCYGDGRVVVLPIDGDGRLTGRATDLAAARDPWSTGDASASATDALVADGLALLLGRSGAAAPDDEPDAVAVADADETAKAPDERPSRAHSSRWLPDGRVATTDLGFDLVRFWRRGSSTAAPLVLDHEVTLPRGVGPRHLTWHESGHLHVLTEYSIEVFTLRAGLDGRYGVVAGAQATADGAQDGDAAAEITVVGSREHLHTSVRGSNRISTMLIRGDGSELRAVADADSGGDWPRHHAEDGMVLHVANQRSGTIDSFAIDERTGEPARRVGRVEVGTPTCLAPARL